MDEETIAEELETDFPEDEIEEPKKDPIVEKLEKHDKDLKIMRKYIKTLAAEIKMLKSNVKLIIEQKE